MRRWTLLFLTSTTLCLAGSGAPLPEIKVGTREPPVVIQRAVHQPGQLSQAQAMLVGEVVKTAEEVVTTPQNVALSESCEVRVEAAFGRCDAIEGIKRAVLESHEDHSPYVPVEPGWGKLRHLKEGQKIVLLLNGVKEKDAQGQAQENEALSFGAEMLLEVAAAPAETRLLPEILRRTGFDPGLFTADDLLVLKAASPFLHEQVLKEGEAERARRQAPKEGWPMGMLAAILMASGGVIWWRWKTSAGERPTGCC